MDSVRSWIAPLLTRALDEHLEITDSKSLRVEDELSNFYIHCDVVEFVQLVEWQSSTPDIKAIIADSQSSVRAVFANASSSQGAQGIATCSLLDLKPGAVFRLHCPEICVSDCFEPARVEIWVKDFSVHCDGGYQQQLEELVEVSTVPVIIDRLGRLTRQRAGTAMARLASSSAHNSSPGLKSQISAGGDSDAENVGDPFVSQTDFGTQIPFSPPKSLELHLTRKTQLLGKRKAMGDLRQLVNESHPLPKKHRLCAEEKGAMDVELSEQTDVEGNEVLATPAKNALKSEGPSKGQDNRSGISSRGGPSVPKSLTQGLDVARDHTTSHQISLPRPASNTISDERLPYSNDYLEQTTRWQDKLAKMTYLPRYLQTISKAQNDLLAMDDKWQPALVGQPTRPGTLPLELLNNLTAAADQKAAKMSDLVEDNQQIVARVQIISKEGTVGVDEEPDLPSLPPILEAVTKATDYGQSEAQEAESESECSTEDWPSSPPRPPRLLPPDSSPLLAAPNTSISSSPAEGASRLIKENEDPVASSPIRNPSVKGLEVSSQTSRHPLENSAGSSQVSASKIKTPGNIREKKASRPLMALGASLAQAEAKIPTCSNTMSPSTKSASAILNSSDNFTQPSERNNISMLHTATSPPSNEVQPPSCQTTSPPLATLQGLQGQPANQQCPPHLSPRLISPTFLQKVVDSCRTGTQPDPRQPEHFTGDFEINSSEDGSVHRAGLSKLSFEDGVRGERPDQSQQVVLHVQNVSQVSSVTPRNLGVAGNNIAAHPTHVDSDIGALSEDAVMAPSDANSWGNRPTDSTNDNELSKHSKRAKLTIASSVLSVPSEGPGFRPVDSMMRQYGREVLSSLRKKDAAAALPPSAVLASNLSPQSESFQSSDKLNSAQTSSLRQIATSTPLTSTSAQAQKIMRKPPAPTSDMSRRSLLQPEDQYLVFRRTYPTYEGNFIQFLKSCRMIKKMRAARKMLPQGVWDDFVYRHHHDYRSYLHDVLQSDELESPISYEDYYADYVSEPVRLKGVLRLAFIEALSEEVESTPAIEFASVRTASQNPNPENRRQSIAASSSASNIQAKESLEDTSSKFTPKDSVTLESQLQLKEQEGIRQSQPSSVHLWLQKASGASAPELGARDGLATSGDILYIDLTGNEDDATFDLATELLPLREPIADVGTGVTRVAVEEARLPHPKTKPFKDFAFAHAKLDAGKNGRSRLRTDAKGALRPEVQGTIDIFTWRG